MTTFRLVLKENAEESRDSSVEDGGKIEDLVKKRAAKQSLELELRQAELLAEVIHHIRESLDLQEILNRAVSGVRSLLQTDRVLIFRFQPDWQGGEVVTESVAEPWLPILGSDIRDNCFGGDLVEPYRQGRIKSIDDIEVANLDPCHIQFLGRYQVRANLVVPILPEGSLWGLLIAHHCSAPRHWQTHEVSLLKQLADQVAVAIHQAQLYRQLQQLNTDLEEMVEERTHQLRQALELEQLLKGIIEKVRDSLDEKDILQTVVEELGRQLGVISCDTALYDQHQQSSTIHHEYLHPDYPLTPAVGRVVSFAVLPDLYRQLLQGQAVQFCPLLPSYRDPSAKIHTRFTVLSCPLMGEQQVLGDMWLYRPAEESFTEAEVRMVQQVASQCVIALRQARLYQASLAQVHELERLNQLKDDFLSTVSHELRSPMASIKMAAKMLSVVLEGAGLAAKNKALVKRYLSILEQECNRETELINDLLELSRLDADTAPLQWHTLNLREWLLQKLDPFQERAALHRQTLEIGLPENCPLIQTFSPYLERIVTELLTNACKYTPAGETITVSTLFLDNTWQLRVTNTGVVIPAKDLERIFERFYRLPNNDPWKYGGTGLGLALSRKLAERLQGSLWAESSGGKTCFILELPRQPV